MCGQSAALLLSLCSASQSSLENLASTNSSKLSKFLARPNAKKSSQWTLTTPNTASLKSDLFLGRKCLDIVLLRRRLTLFRDCWSTIPVRDLAHWHHFSTHTLTSCATRTQSCRTVSPCQCFLTSLPRRSATIQTRAANLCLTGTKRCKLTKICKRIIDHKKCKRQKIYFAISF